MASMYVCLFDREWTGFRMSSRSMRGSGRRGRIGIEAIERSGFPVVSRTTMVKSEERGGPDVTAPRVDRWERE